MLQKKNKPNTYKFGVKEKRTKKSLVRYIIKKKEHKLFTIEKTKKNTKERKYK